MKINRPLLNSFFRPSLRLATCSPVSFRSWKTVIALTGVLSATLAPEAHAAAKTWDGGGGDGNWSTGANWDLDTAPTVTGDTLVFAGTSNLNAVNNGQVTNLATTGTSITFAAGAGSFVLSGSTITVGSGGGGGQVIILQQSANNQTISNNLNLSGGNGDRSIVFGAGAGTLTLSGNINFGTTNGDWLFPNTTAGTIILSGSNTGDGKATNAITAGTNTMRAMMRNNVAGTQLVLGSDYALGNSGTGSIAAGTAGFRGIIANQNMSISTQGGDRNLSGSTLAINAGNITFNGANNLTIGNIVNVGGNRDFVVSSAGQVTVQDSISLSSDTTGRQLYINLSGAGGMVVNGAIYDTFSSLGVTTGTSTLRKAGTATLTLNGNSAYTGLTQIDAGNLRVGNANALGAGGTASSTSLAGGNLDLNGFSIAETVVVNNAASQLLNTSGTAASLTADATVNTNFTIDTTGNITTARLIATGSPRTITKAGAGTLTTSGTSHNNLIAWTVSSGTLVFANTSGLAADRGVTINAGTLMLSGSNPDLINDSQTFTMNGGVFDLNGKSEAIAAVIGSSGAVIRNGAGGAATLFVGGGLAGTSSGTFAGTIVDGTGVLNLVKEGTGTQTLTGVNTYSGNTSVNNGSLVVADNAGLEFTIGSNGVNNAVLGTGTVSLDGDFTFDLAGAGTGLGDSWTIVNVGTLNETFGATFSVVGWTEVANVWSFTSGVTTYEFAESTGVLQVVAVPEPGTFGVVVVGLLALRALRRRRH